MFLLKEKNTTKIKKHKIYQTIYLLIYYIYHNSISK